MRQVRETEISSLFIRRQFEKRKEEKEVSRCETCQQTTLSGTGREDRYQVSDRKLPSAPPERRPLLLPRAGRPTSRSLPRGRQRWSRGLSGPPAPPARSNLTIKSGSCTLHTTHLRRTGGTPSTPWPPCRGRAAPGECRQW